ncbi:MFS transporter [Microbacterium deminutum]|uniref:MFS transporter n=1 Tax=Microbacterium deminutum TaxID=344164 RepID=A0ABP5BSZ1_9MICO
MTRPPGKVGATWLTLFTLAWLAIWTVQLTPIQLLLPLQLNTPDSASGWIQGVVSSGLILGVGGLVALVAVPVAGGLSDRTRLRWGRRRPWAVGGSLLAGASLAAMAFAKEPLAVGAGWVGVSVGLALAMAAFTALIADQLTTQRGAASASVSSSQAVGIVLGVGVVVLLGLGIAAGYLLLAVFIAVVGTVTAALLPDPLPESFAHVGGARVPLSERFAILRNRDFAWMLSGRLAVNIGNALGTGLLLFFLLYGLHQDPAGAEDNLLLLIVVYTVFVVIASIAAGAVSDRTGRRKGLVVWSSLIQAAAAVLIAVAPGFEVTLVAAALLGVGYGAFSTVGLAFATDMLGEEDHALDLGLVTVASNLGQLLGPLIGAGLVALVGGFWLLFAASALLSVVGALMNAVVRAPVRVS